MIQLANTMMSLVSNLFTVQVPGLGISFMTLFIGIIVIDIVLRTVFIILGVSSGADDLPASMLYDGLASNDMFDLAPRSRRWEVNKTKIDSDSAALAAEHIKSRAKHYYVKGTNMINRNPRNNKISLSSTSYNVPRYLFYYKRQK